MCYLFCYIVKVETGVFNFFSGLFDNYNLQPLILQVNKTKYSLIFDIFKSVTDKFELYVITQCFIVDLRKSLYGQNIALETVLNAVTWFMKDPDPPKQQVLS